jgi:hypothetical protein
MVTDTYYLKSTISMHTNCSFLVIEPPKETFIYHTMDILLIYTFILTMVTLYKIYSSNCKGVHEDNTTKCKLTYNLFTNFKNLRKGISRT